MASTTIDQVAVQLVAKIDGLTQTVKGFKWQQSDLDTVPAGVVGIPDIRRQSPNDREPQMNSWGWYLDFPLRFYVDLDEPNRAANEIMDIVEAFIKAIDADETLGGLIGVGHDGVPRVTSAQPFEQLDTEQNRSLMACELRVEVPRLVTP